MYVCIQYLLSIAWLKVGNVVIQTSIFTNKSWTFVIVYKNDGVKDIRGHPDNLTTVLVINFMTTTVLAIDKV